MKCARTFAVMLAGLLGLLLPALSHAQYGRVRRGTTPAGSPVNSGPYKDMAGEFHGKVKVLNKKEITIQNDENQMVTMRRTGKTKFYKDDKEIKATDIDLETPITIEAKEDTDIKLLALKVTVDPPQKKADEVQKQ
jgi:hypothetical protein